MLAVSGPAAPNGRSVYAVRIGAVDHRARYSGCAPEADEAALEARIRCTLQGEQAARQTCQESIQMHGGMGMMQEVTVGHHLKRVTVMNSMLGDARWHLRRTRPWLLLMVEDLWIFGYGSLIWKPDIPFDEQRVVRTRGWARRFGKVHTIAVSRMLPVVSSP